MPLWCDGPTVQQRRPPKITCVNSSCMNPMGIQLQIAMFESLKIISFRTLFVWRFLHSVFTILTAHICVRPFARAHGKVCCSCREPHQEAPSLVPGPCQATTSTSSYSDHQGSIQNNMFWCSNLFLKKRHPILPCGVCRPKWMSHRSSPIPTWKQPFEKWQAHVWNPWPSANH